MPEHNRVVDGPAVLGGPLMQIAAANAHRVYREDYIVTSWNRFLDLANLNAVRFTGKVNDGCILHVFYRVIRPYRASSLSITKSCMD